MESNEEKWINEIYCTGNASDIEKFAKWAETVPFTIGNPLYHWTHLELARYFGITEFLSPASAEKFMKILLHYFKQKISDKINNKENERGGNLHN